MSAVLQVIGGAAVGALGVYAYLRRKEAADVVAASAENSAALLRRLYINVHTDMQPDDLLALGVLHRRGIVPDTITAGEGNSFRKQIFLRRVWWDCLCRDEPRSALKPSGWFYDDPMAVKPFSWSAKSTGFSSNNFGPGEVRDVRSDGLVTTDSFAAELSAEHLTNLEETKELVQKANGHPMGPVLLCLKPPREILAMLEHHPERARAVFKDTTLVMTGSYNLGALGYSKTLPLVQEGTTPFKKVYLYEAHANPDVPNLNPTTVPNMGDWFAHLPLFRQALQDSALKWDTHNIEDCRRTMEQEVAAGRAGSPAYVRNQKCLMDTQRNPGKQFVPADGVLALLLANKDFEPYLKAVRVEHDGDDTRCPTALYRPVDADAKVVAWVGLPGDKVVAELTRVCSEPLAARR